MNHSFVSEDSGVSCLVCGAYYESEPDNITVNRCSGRTDLVHPACGDASSHSLDNCTEFDATGDCEHLAYRVDCDCDACKS